MKFDLIKKYSCQVYILSNKYMDIQFFLNFIMEKSWFIVTTDLITGLSIPKKKKSKFSINKLSQCCIPSKIMHKAQTAIMSSSTERRYSNIRPPLLTAKVKINDSLPTSAKSIPPLQLFHFSEVGSSEPGFRIFQPLYLAYLLREASRINLRNPLADTQMRVSSRPLVKRRKGGNSFHFSSSKSSPLLYSSSAPRWLLLTFLFTEFTWTLRSLASSFYSMHWKWWFRSVLVWVVFFERNQLVYS